MFPAGYNPQVVSVASLSRAQVCHEMGHSFGLQHENIRPDAASFITVLTQQYHRSTGQSSLVRAGPHNRHEWRLRLRIRHAPGLGF